MRTFLYRVALLSVFATTGVMAAEAAKTQNGLTLDQQIEKARKDVGDAAGKLRGSRRNIARRRAPLAKKIQEAEAEIRVLRERVRVLDSGSSATTELLKADVATQTQEMRAIAAIATEYRRSLETRLGVADLQRLQPQLNIVDVGLANPEELAVMKTVGNALKLAGQTAPRMFGGSVFAGTCLDVSGRELSGRFVTLGPLTYFATADGLKGGIVTPRAGSSMPGLHAASPEDAILAVFAMVEGERSRVPMDLTGGDAMRVAQSRLSLTERLKKGGYTMIPLMGIAVIAGVLALWKMMSLSGVRSCAPALVDQVVSDIQAGDVASAETAAASAGSVLAPILSAGISYAHVRRDALEEIMHERMLAVVPVLDKHLSTLAVIGGVAPLLGLLGTVTGMVHTFNLVTIFGSGDARLLSGGISEALITTMVGLTIAIPVLLVHAYLVRRVRTIVMNLEQSIVQFINRVSIEDSPHV